MSSNSQDQSYYSYIIRFLDSDLPTVNSSIKDFLLKDGAIQILIHFITQNFPPHIKREDSSKSSSTGALSTSSNSVFSNSSNGSGSSSNGKSPLGGSTGSMPNNTTPMTTTTSTSTSASTSTSTTSTSTTSTGSLGTLFQNGANNNRSSLTLAIDPNIPPEIVRSYKVMDLFVHPTPPFISLAKEKLPLIVNTLFGIFKCKHIIQSKIETSVETTNFETKGNIYHFCKVIQCLFSQYTFYTIEVLSEIYPPAQKTYFQVLIENMHFQPIQDLLIVISKRASRSVNEYQTTNPMDTKKIQKGLLKSKFYQNVSNYFIHSTLKIDIDSNYIVLEGSTDFMIRCIEEMNIYGPDIGVGFCFFQSKDFGEHLNKVLANEGGKKSSGYSFEHRYMALRIINTMINRSIEHSNNNTFQAEKDSIFSSGGTTLWLQYFSTIHMNSVCKLLLDMAVDPNFKKTLTSFRVEALTLLIDMIKQRGLKKKITSQAYISPELWTHLVDWFFQFNNIYHSKFYGLIVELFLQNHSTSIKYFCTHHLKKFIQCYSETQNNEYKGIILLMLNYIRLSSDSQSSSQYLPTFLKGYEVWTKFLPCLLLDTFKQYHSMSVSKLGSILPNIDNFSLSNILSQDLSPINLGSEFAESIGFEDENKKMEHLNALLSQSQIFMIDELNNDSPPPTQNSNNNNSSPKLLIQD
ncbi:hypothetical protein DFA_08720 [Cavenderia fasciculata]|uniref:Uncharacterized protein n=1 Tax=Cavenderia fasciculata TaxID=261658 RepID=F4Q3W6_CACFS|nr:uncharacterized protein DFA_08720 [Cavenderia fasciculata]EGG17722.1 hypothetical protein DFA_08720 [Cavenderia fasciculata]|eukprot:XP_004356206.1 hypothetical protein DFA_08720 [Cavenderia fasciculata]